ncbi:MAG: 2-succinyl-5-enolpyruvyl-6-hydroxy-3-cyclohexene-1-carboxylic-acid synthase [Bacteroidetes bacterium SW_9_63_38]|nr:MAG: 2-succinyl-5-enolpyruvyl-6-hydroxy-3-cyclohexene-1-carboxylic-acid synthase [Bacteroidetes bacterium SW_9_63_38]
MHDRSYSPLDAPNPTYLWARLLVEELGRSGVTTFFVAPGSRSTPLTVAAARHPDAEVVLHVDERGTAFAALGYGRVHDAPAAWITTSGTAVANGHPAVVEAATDGVPMMLLTADRPPELRDTGANQTVDQVKVFGDHVRYFVDVPPPSDDVDPAYVLTTADQAVHRAQRVPPGPVHLNCGFRKPLEPVPQQTSIDVPRAVSDWAEDTAPYTKYPPSVETPSDAALDRLVDAVADLQRGLVVVGRLDRPDDADAVCRLAQHLGWPLVPALTSRLRLGEGDEAVRIPYADLALTSEALQEVGQPEAVLQLGGRFTAKRLRLFLRDAAPSVWAVVRPDPSRIDPDHRTTHHIEAHVAPFVDAVDQRVGPSAEATDWTAGWRAADAAARSEVDRHAEEGGLTEPAVATHLTQHIPSSHALVAASSMPVRDLNRHACADGAPVPVVANRGASGIDGTVATTAGVARALDRPATLLIGDLALWHDLNSLALLSEQPIVVVVINNDGGGIFHFLPIEAHEDVFEPHFTTPQGRTFEGAADTFGLAYRRPDTVEAFQEAYREACDRAGPSLIEVHTDRSENREVHEQLERKIAAAVDAVVG